MAFSHQTNPLSIIEILLEAFKLPTKNFTLILPITLLSFLTSSVLFAFTNLPIDPVATDLVVKSISIASTDSKSPEYAIILAEILKDLKELIRIVAIFVITSFVVSLLIEIATVNVFFLTFSTKISTVDDLLYKLGNRLKGPMISKLYVKIFRDSS